jgi:hypothetical protein
MTEDEQLLEEYSKEILGKYYYGTRDNMTLAILIESHRSLRNLNIEQNGVYNEARKEGYENGYKMGVKNAAENTIMLEDLRKMTVQDLANLIGDENDY